MTWRRPTLTERVQLVTAATLPSLAAEVDRAIDAAKPAPLVCPLCGEELPWRIGWRSKKALAFHSRHSACRYAGAVWRAADEPALRTMVATHEPSLPRWAPG